MVYDNIHQKLESYDPYDFGPYETELQEKMVEENQNYHRKIQSFITNNYLKPEFETFYEGMLLEENSIIHIPPNIPGQVNDFDCGVYMLQFAKHIALNKQFGFNSEHIENFREDMKIEIFLNKLMPIKYTKKRKVDSTKKKAATPTKKSEVPQRRFSNRLLEDCWMNSTLQMILTGLDHFHRGSEHGSSLWSTLIYLKNQDKQKALDPLPVKKLLLSRENERTLSEIGNQNMVLQTAGNRAPNRLLEIGQQDAKDFFVCLKQNQIYWPDVFNLFKIRMRSISECRNCGHRSTQANSNDFMFLEYSCPDSGTKMSTYMIEKMEQPESIPDWRDEEGCGLRSTAMHYSKIENIDETEFIIVVLRRLVDFGNGPMILRNNVLVDHEVWLSDIQNRSSKFRPLSVIFHIGDVQGKDTFGHYKADVRNLDGNWYRTSDDMMPQMIKEAEVSDQGYIYLYQKVC